MNFNEGQQKAIDSNSRIILCLAGAGTGKTAVLTNRVARLVKERNSCGNMLALTFTRAAGKEMKERVQKLIGSEGKKLFCNTFHALGVKIINEFGYLLDIEEGFTIYEYEDVEAIIENIIKVYNYDVKKNKILSILDNRAKIETREEEKVISEFEYNLKKNNAVTLSDLIKIMVVLLENFPEVKKHYNNLFRFIFVDEFQDTNENQMKLIKLLVTEDTKLFVVGDDFQAIYGFRGGIPEYIVNFTCYLPGGVYPEAEIIKLEENYRCTNKIVAAANKLIKYNINQTEKKLIANKTGIPVFYGKYETIYEEAEGIANKINNTLRKKSDFAILTRTNKEAEFLSEQLNEFGIENKIYVKNKDPYNDFNVKKIFNIMEFALNPINDFLFKKIINFPERQISNLEIKKMENEGTLKQKCLFYLLSEDHAFKQKIIKIQKRIIEKDPNAAQIYTLIYNLFNIDKVLIDQKLTNRLEPISKALSNLSSWCAYSMVSGKQPNTLNFLRYLRLKDISEYYSIKKEDKVQIMTMHGSKGLEFEVVFLPKLNFEFFPHKRGEIEEERRLCYVGITRAREELYVSYVDLIKKPYAKKYTEAFPSQFIQEMQLNFMQKIDF